VIEHRLKTITNHEPTQLVKGKARWDGYIVFCFPDQDIYILEHLNYGNATYVFGEDWEKYANLIKRGG